MAPSVHIRVDFDRPCPTGMLGDNVLHAALIQFGDDHVGIAGLVRNQCLELNPLNQGRSADCVVTMPWQSFEAYKNPQSVGQGQDLGGLTAFRLSDGLAPESPFCALAVPVNFDNGCTGHGVLHIWLIRTGLEKPNKNIGFYPIPVALEDRIPLAEMWRQVPPWSTSARDPRYRLDEETIVTAAAPRVRRLPETMRLHLRPLGVRQHEAIHSKLESQIAYRGNPISQQALAQMTGASSRSMDRFEPVVVFLLYSLLLECHGR